MPPTGVVSSAQADVVSADSCVQCDRVSASTEAIKTKLQNEYDATVEVLKDGFFATINGGPQLEAHADPYRFVAKYFLTTGLLGGIPDRNKTTTPLAV